MVPSPVSIAQQRACVLQRVNSQCFDFLQVAIAEQGWDWSHWSLEESQVDGEVNWKVCGMLS